MDNRRENLRLATPSQNQWNKTANKTNRLGHKGIRLESGKYKVAVKKNYKQYYGGRYATMQEAIEAHAKLATKLHGDFALKKQQLAGG